MKVVDAGVVVEPLAGSLDPERLGDEELASPHLIDSEVTHVLRGLVRRGALSEAGDSRTGRISSTHAHPVPGGWLRPRMWALRHNLSACDAAYVALTERRHALLTTDARLANTPGLECHIEMLRRGLPNGCDV